MFYNCKDTVFPLSCSFIEFW